jgi:hypothetical protein
MLLGHIPETCRSPVAGIPRATVLPVRPNIHSGRFERPGTSPERGIDADHRRRQGDPVTYHPPYPAKPSAPKPAPWKVIGGLTAGILVLCCGGLTAVGYFADDPDANRAASFSETAPATGDAGETTSRPATATGKPARSAAPGTARSKPAPSRTTTAPRTAKPAPARTTTKPKPKPTTKSPKAVYYENCDAVRAAGAAPIRRGDPGYAPHLDRDGDGEGCGGD